MRYATKNLIVTLLALSLSAACVPIEDDEPYDGFDDLGCDADYTLQRSDILLTCAYITGALYGREASCIPGFEDPDYITTWDPNETPKICEAYGPFCWKCAQIYGQNPFGDEFYGDEVVACLNDLVQSADTCDVGYVASAEAGPCWMIATGGQL